MASRRRHIRSVERAMSLEQLDSCKRPALDV